MPHQADLFADDAPPAHAALAGAALVRIAGPTAKLSKAQREFNRLSDRLARLREHLAQWRAATDRCAQRGVSELLPLQTRLAALQAETVLWIDAYLARPPQGERLPKKLRAKLVAMLRLLAGPVLDAGPHPEVEAAHDRHSPQGYRHSQREQADLAAAVLGQAMGDPSLFDGEADSVEALMQRAAQRAQAQAEAGGDDPEPPAPAGSRAAKAQARDAKALKEASQSVRDVYRRLASSLHPDREPDASERQRKTQLMAQVNEAYARQALLALLALQMDLEQINTAALAGVPDERLRHYSRVLKEQQQVLEEELALLQVPVCEHAQAAPGLLNWSAAMLQQVFEADLQNLRSAIGHLQEDGQALRDPATRLQLLRALEIDDPDAGPDPFEELLLMQALGALEHGPGPGPMSRSPSGRRKRGAR